MRAWRALRVGKLPEWLACLLPYLLPYLPACLLACRQVPGTRNAICARHGAFVGKNGVCSNAELDGAANGVALYELELRRRGLVDGTDRTAQRSAEERHLQHFPDGDSSSRALAPARLPAQRRMDQACLRRAAA